MLDLEQKTVHLCYIDAIKQNNTHIGVICKTLVRSTRLELAQLKIATTTSR